MKSKILFVGRNILKSEGKRGTDSFFADLFAKAASNSQFDFLGLSADDSARKGKKTEESSIIRVPSSILPKGMDKSHYYTDLWTGKIKRSLAKKIINKNLDSLRVGTELKKLLKQLMPTTIAMSWLAHSRALNAEYSGIADHMALSPANP